MGTYTYTLRTKSQNVELPGGEIVPANLLGYLCRSNDHDTFMLYPGDYGYKRAMALNAQIEACEQRWWRHGPVYVIQEDAKQGYTLYHVEDPQKAYHWYDCEDYAKSPGVTVVGRLGPRVRRGRRLVWTVMTEAEAEAFDAAERAKMEASAKAYQAKKRAEQKARIRARVEALNAKKLAQSLDSAGL